MTQQSLFDELGGEPVLRKIIDRFVDRLFDDVMIGFLFQAGSATRERIKEKEFELAAQHLGAPVEYTGRPLQTAHRRHKIMTGHFMRRLQILKDTLDEHGVSERVRRHWVDLTLEQMPLVMNPENDQCQPPPARKGD
ncbi:MAG TPA: group 1 truncated hemoglobin [Polyangiaceae bacterium]|nr:group 1 truncated hemoglobin [Polyangiaceae bacterium]